MFLRCCIVVLLTPFLGVLAVVIVLGVVSTAQGNPYGVGVLVVSAAIGAVYVRLGVGVVRDLWRDLRRVGVLEADVVPCDCADPACRGWSLYLRNVSHEKAASLSNPWLGSARKGPGARPHEYPRRDPS